MRQKIKDFIDDCKYSFRHLRGTLHKEWDILKRYLAYYPVCRKVYDFDFTGILYSERFQIERTIEAVRVDPLRHLHVGHDIFWMKTALKMLEIVLEEDDFYEILRDREMSINADGTVDLPPSRYIFKKYVNTRNYRRFHPEIPEIKDMHLPSIRIAKAWYLYNKIKHQYLFHWWA